MSSGVEVRVVDALSNLLAVYHEAYAAHHDGKGPRGCPCCAEFGPRIAAGQAEAMDALDAWEDES